MAYAIDKVSAGFINADTADSPPDNTMQMGMFNPSPLFLKSGLVAGESGGIPGFESTSAAISAPAAVSSVAPSWWDSIRNDMGQAVDNLEKLPGVLYTDAKGITKTVYDDISGGVGTVYDDATGKLAGTATSYYWYALLALVVVGTGIYFIGKTGAIKVNAIV